MQSGLQDRVVTIDVRDRNHRFVSGATVEMWVNQKRITSAEKITKPATFHVNDTNAPLEFVAKYGGHKSSVKLAQDAWDYEILLQNLEMPPDAPHQSFIEAHLAFVFGVGGLILAIILAIFFPNSRRPDLYKYFAILAALSGGGIASEIPGFLNLRYSPSGKFIIAAGGALAVFVIMYFFKPA